MAENLSRQDVQQMIDEALQRSFALPTKKYGDTPTDANQLTPQKYVSSVVSSVATTAASALSLAQKRNVLYRVLAPTTANSLASVVGGDLVMPFAGSITGIGATVDTAGTGSVATYNVFNNATSILSTLITIDSTEKSSRTAATPTVIAFPNVQTGDTLTFQVDHVQSVAALGLTFFLDVNRPQ